MRRSWTAFVALAAAGAAGCFDVGAPAPALNDAETGRPPPSDSMTPNTDAVAGGTDSGATCGACELVCPIDDTVAGPVTFSDVQTILSNNCALGPCHSGGALGNGENLTSGNACANTVNVPAVETMTTTMLDRVEPTDPANSYLYDKISGTFLSVGGSGCTMPRNGCCLSPQEIGTIRRWILDGATCL